jgi:DNA-binding Lrp family transcriptional regulator
MHSKHKDQPRLKSGRCEFKSFPGFHRPAQRFVENRSAIGKAILEAKGRSFDSPTELARAANVSEQTVTRALEDLRRNGTESRTYGVNMAYGIKLRALPAVMAALATMKERMDYWTEHPEWLPASIDLTAFKEMEYCGFVLYGTISDNQAIVDHIHKVGESEFHQAPLHSPDKLRVIEIPKDG